MTVYIDLSPGKGRGVFAAKDFKKGDIIETCPVLVVEPKDYEHLEKMHLTNYAFAWGEDDEGYCICFGYGSMYNHSFEPNIEFETDLPNFNIVFKALRDIRQGEELCSDYNWDDDAELEPWYIELKKNHRKDGDEKSPELMELELNIEAGREDPDQ